VRTSEAGTSQTLNTMSDIPILRGELGNSNTSLRFKLISEFREISDLVPESPSPALLHRKLIHKHYGQITARFDEGGLHSWSDAVNYARSLQESSVRSRPKNPTSKKKATRKSAKKTASKEGVRNNSSGVIKKKNKRDRRNKQPEAKLQG
jgi:hypothetical protein